MSFPVLFVLVCLAPFAIVCDEEYNWVPEEVPMAAQQCLDMNYKGQCVSSSRLSIHWEICRDLRCAEGRRDSYSSSPMYRAYVGTQCGDNKVCRFTECIDIPASKVPRYTGRNITQLC